MYEEEIMAHHKEDPLHAIAYEESWLKGLFNSVGLTVELVRYGTWTGSKDRGQYQDIVVFKK